MSPQVWLCGSSVTGTRTVKSRMEARVRSDPRKVWSIHVLSNVYKVLDKQSPAPVPKGHLA